MNSDSRRLTLSILLATSLHAAVASTLLVVEESKPELYPEGEYIELGAIEVPEGMQVVQPDVKPEAPKKVVPKPESLVVKEATPSESLPEKNESLPEVELQQSSNFEEAVVTDSEVETTTTAVEELPVDESAEALAEEMLQEESEILAQTQEATPPHPVQPKVDPVVERRKKLREKRLAELQKQQKLRAEKWKNRSQQLAQSQATSMRYGLPNGSRDARTLSQLPGNPRPLYPLPARRKGWEGNVVLAYFVTPSGHVQQLKVLRSSGHQVLDQEAVRTISRYRYSPGQAGWTYHPVQFNLSGQAQTEFSGLRTQ